jgi:hypothetical protein
VLNAAVAHDVPAAPDAPVGETYHVVLLAATPDAATSEAPSNNTDPPSEPANRTIRPRFMRFPPVASLTPHPEGSDSPLAQRDGLATVWDAALVELRESLCPPTVAGVCAFCGNRHVEDSIPGAVSTGSGSVARTSDTSPARVERFRGLCTY